MSCVTIKQDSVSEPCLEHTSKLLLVIYAFDGLTIIDKLYFTFLSGLFREL